MQLHGKTSLKEDDCYIQLRQYQSSNPGTYKLSTPGFKPTQSVKHYSNELTDLAHYPKPYANHYKYSTLESQLQQSALTQFRQNKQLFSRPYLGAYMGVGQNTANNKDLESELLTGEIAKISRANNLAGITIDRFSYLPECNYPQRVQHIIHPTVVRGGEATRDFVRRNIHIKKTHRKMLH
jgi:hypothetical protein